jgi:hypothetical protein
MVFLNIGVGHGSAVGVGIDEQDEQDLTATSPAINATSLRRIEVATSGLSLKGCLRRS